MFDVRPQENGSYHVYEWRKYFDRRGEAQLDDFFVEEFPTQEEADQYVKTQAVKGS